MKKPINKPNSVALAYLNPLDYKDLSRSAFQILRRLVVLTKTATQECIFNNDQTKELGFSDRTGARAIALLSEKGFAHVEYKTTPLGPNSRVVTLVASKLILPDSANKPTAPKEQLKATAPQQTAPAKANTQLYTASVPKADTPATVVTDAQSLLCDKSGDEEDAKFFATRCFTEDVWQKIINTDPNDPLVRRYARYQARRLIAPNSAQMLCHQELYHFDFTDALAARGFGPIRFGNSEPTAVVDFTEFAEYMSADNATDKPNYYDTSVFRPWMEKYYRFCIMTEISYYSDQLFSAPETCDRTNLDKIKRFFGQHQQGLFPEVMAPMFGLDYVDARNGDDDYWYCSEGLWRCISAKYIPRANQSPVKYLTSCVIRQFLDAIADEDNYQRSFKAFLYQFSHFACCQRWNNDANLTLHGTGELITKHYYPLPLNQLLEIYGVKIRFRVTYPMLLMRKAVMSYSVAGLFDWYIEGNLAHCRDLIKMAATNPDVKAQWDAFKAFYCHDYPFLNKLEAANV